MKSNLQFGVLCVIVGIFASLAFKVYIDHLFPTAHYAKALPEVKPGDVWQYTLFENDPFTVKETRTFKVLDVKKGKDGNTYVKSLWVEIGLERSEELSWFVVDSKKISP